MLKSSQSAVASACSRQRCVVPVLSGGHLHSLGRVRPVGVQSWAPSHVLSPTRPGRHPVMVYSGDGATVSSTKLLGFSVPSNLYLGIQLGELLLIVMLADAAFSGDWSRIGAISKSTELVLQKVFYFITVAHAATGVLAAKAATSKGLNPIWIGVRGFLFGSLEVNRVSQMPDVAEVADAQQPTE